MFDLFSPRRSLKEIRQDFDNLFDDFHNYNLFYETNSNPPEYVVVSGDNYPRTDIQTYTKDGVKYALVEMSVPGLTKDFVEVSLTDGILSVRGKKVGIDSVDAVNPSYKLKELHRSSFYREFNLNRLFDVDNDSAEVTLSNGILSVVVKAKGEVKKSKKLLEIKE